MGTDTVDDGPRLNTLPRARVYLDTLWRLAPLGALAGALVSPLALLGDNTGRQELTVDTVMAAAAHGTKSAAGLASTHFRNRSHSAVLVSTARAGRALCTPGALPSLFDVYVCMPGFFGLR